MTQETHFALAELPMPMVYATHRTIRDCNSIFAEQFGYTVEELRNSGFNKLYPEFADFVRVGKIWRHNLAGGNTYYDERIMRHRDGTRFWCRVHGRSQNREDPFAAAVYCFELAQAQTIGKHHPLTPRQLQIVTLVAQGKTSAVIANELELSVRTIEAHRARLMRTLGLRNSAELIAWFSSDYRHAENSKSSGAPGNVASVIASA